ncbi:IclR family transcriptional regulator [Streptomyces sp. CA-179760]|uniref:IclR family transcriptional regulator n=1 Tax=Streptomyces sp. CA-179760 TaxID=3240054 RepID=UPI003D92769D
MDSAIDVVGRVSVLLRTLSAHEPAGATTTVIARAAGLARPTAHRLLSSMRSEGLTDRDDASGKWHLGPEIYLLGLVASARHDATDIARSTVRRVARETGESAFFSARRGDETVCLLREDGSFPIRSHVLYEGIRFPLGVASAGLAILSFLDTREQTEYLRDTDLATVYGDAHHRDRLTDQIGRTRRMGYAVNPGLIVPGSWGIGAAVFDREGSPRWALSITGVEARLTPPRQQQIGKLLLSEAHALSQRISEHGRA